MSPTRRDILKAAGAIPVALALGHTMTPVESALTAESFTMEYLFVGAKMGEDHFSILGTESKAPELHEYVTFDDGRCVTATHPLSPKGQRMWNDCLARMAAVFAMEEDEEGWD